MPLRSRAIANTQHRGHTSLRDLLLTRVWGRSSVPIILRVHLCVHVSVLSQRATRLFFPLSSRHLMLPRLELDYCARQRERASTGGCVSRPLPVMGAGAHTKAQRAREEGKLGSALHHAKRTASARAHNAGFDRGGARRTVLGAHLVEDTVPTEAAADRVLGLDLVRLPAVAAKVGCAAAWAHEQVERGVMIHGMVGEGALILKQFASVDEPLLVGGHSQAALLDQVLQLRDRRRRLDGELKSNT